MDLDVATAVVLGTGVGGVVSIGCAVAAWRNRVAPGAVLFGWLLFAAGGWAFLTAATMTATDATVVAALRLLARITTASMTTLWLLFALTYTGRGDLLTGPRIVGAFAVTHGYVFLLLSGLVQPTVEAVTRNGLTLFVVAQGPLYTLQTAVSIGVFLLGYGLLVEYLLHSRNVYRTQTMTLVVGSIFPPIVHFLFVTGATPHPGMNLSPLTFVVTALFVSLALFRYDFLRVTPLAETILVDELPDPVLVLNQQETVVDYNDAAVETFDTATPAGGPLDALAPGLRSNVERGNVFSLDDGATYYEPHVSPITDDHGEGHGRLVVLRNVTGQQRRQDRLEALQTATQQFIEAKQPETVADLAVNYVTDILDQNAAGVFLVRDDELHPVALSDAVREYMDERLFQAGPEDSQVEPLWQTFEDGTGRVADLGEGTGPLESALLLPLGDHGVLAIGSKRASYAPADRQYASILARTTQVALDQVERERELRVRREVSRRRREQIDFFNGVLRHSLRNAMLVIQGRAEYLDERLPSEHHHHVESITDWCGRLTDLSATIRGISDTISASEEDGFVTVDLPMVLRQAVRTVEAEAPNAEFALQIDERVDVEATEMAEEVLESVLRNAVEHNDTDDPHVEVTLERASDWVQVRIADDGPGISEELKATMYERSITPSQTAGGFGLYFVSVMMELYGGTVWFEDNEPRGAVAVLEFQQAAEPGPSPAAETQAKSPDD